MLYHFSPAPTYKWSRVDGIPLTDRHQVINYGRVLRIENVKLEDAVRYKCLARNNVGSASTEIQLIIQSKLTVFFYFAYFLIFLALPLILRPMVDQLIAVNKSATFYCLIPETNNAKIRTTLEWFHDGRPLVPLLLSRVDRRRIKITSNELAYFIYCFVKITYYYLCLF